MVVREILTYVNDMVGISIYDSRKDERGGQRELARFDTKSGVPDWILDSQFTQIDVGFDSDLWIDIIVEDENNET